MKFLYLFFGGFLLTSCISSQNSLNLFSIEDDINFGRKVVSEIESDTSEYKLLDSVQFSSVYRYIYDVRNTILASGQVRYAEEFPWRIRIIHDDSTLNAFCTPGGYIYFFTGILKYLESEDQLAGVLGHEMGHADKRHSTRQMTKMFGIQVLMQVVAGNKEMLQQITSALIGLKFSREHETEADNSSVEYLCPTAYNAAGGAGFFIKIQADGGVGVPEFLSTHPSPSNRVENYNSKKTELNCAGQESFVSRYKEMQGQLPN